MFLHEDQVELYDRVYDVSTGRGYGIVTRIRQNTFEVRFSRYTLTYTPDGIQTGKTVPTLYWDVPVVLKPRKHDNNTQKRQELIARFFELIGEAGAYFNGEE